MTQNYNTVINSYNLDCNFYHNGNEVEASIIVNGEEQYFYYDDIPEDLDTKLVQSELCKSAIVRHKKDHE